MDNFVPAELRFQRYANEATLGRHNSELLRLSPTFYARFAGDTTLKGHIADRLAGLRDCFEAGRYYVPARLADIWASLEDM